MKRKIVTCFCTLLMVFLWLQSVAIAEPQAPEMPAEVVPIESAFTDPIFLQAVREIIGKTNGESIYPADVENITTLEVVSLDITNLDGIEYFTDLRELYCYDNEITVLDLSHNHNLEVLDCSYNVCMNALDVSNCPELQVLECNYNLDLHSLDLSHNPNLTRLICYSMDLKALDVSSNPLNDVAANAWYADAVAWAAENGLIEGYDNGMFGPEQPVTGAEVAMVLWRHANNASDGDLLDALGWAGEKGILTDGDNGTFAPLGKQTRAEVAAMLQRYFVPSLL